MRILAVNAGSSSVKCWFGEADSADRVVEKWHAQGAISSADDLADALPQALEALWKQIGGANGLDAVAHRVVHAGAEYRQTTWLTREVREAIDKNRELAPSHNGLVLAAIAAMDKVLKDPSRQLAVFDTSFHKSLAPEAYVYPGPYEWFEQGIRRYGFHGISHAHASRRAAQLMNRPLDSLRMITCHLGNGCSLAAIQNGKSIDTTMGYTPADGLMMGSRCGSIDPGIIVRLLRQGNCSADRLDRIFNKESGLKGISGISGDMREIESAIAAGNERAKLAFDIYVHRLCREIGAMLAVLGGLDALVFTGGVGENCPPLRERVAAQLAFLGLVLDSDKNANAEPDIDVSQATSLVRVLVIHANEELEMAREAARLLSLQEIPK